MCCQSAFVISPLKMAPKAKFAEGERVLCFHGPLLYEAKCVKAEVKEKIIRYFIHYNGWNKNWDEWVPESRVLKYNEMGLQKQKELMKAHVGSKKTKSYKKPEKERAPTPSGEKQQKQNKPGNSSSESTSSNSSSSTPTTPMPTATTTPATSIEQKRKRAKLDATVEMEESYQTKIEVKVKLPDELKPLLVDDWDLITRQKQLVSLPARVTVDMILDEYTRLKTLKGNTSKGFDRKIIIKKDAVEQITQGIREYFNVMLGTQLLYKFERPQYAEILSDFQDKPMSSVYGSMHLLRLFVKIGGMLAYTALDEKSINLLLTHIHDFLRYMQKNSSYLFKLSDYIVASPEYHRKAI